MDRQNRTKLDRHKINRTGLPKRGCEDKAARIRQQGQNIQERTERRGQKGENCRYRTLEQDRQNTQDCHTRTSSTGLRDRAARIGLPAQD
jgi:hypothetical protein